MNLLWHIVGKDLRRHGVVVIAWSLMLVAKVALSAIVFSPAAGAAEWFESMQFAYGVAATVESVVSFLLAAALVLDDPLVGSQMFWATRPISGRRLLAAKVVAVLALLFLWPTTVWLPWWIWCGVEGRELFRAALGLWLMQGVIVAPAVVLATLVDRSARFLQVLVGLVVALLAFPLARGAGQFRPEPIAMTLADTRALLAGVALSAALGGVIWMQFTSRRRRRSWTILLAGFVAAIVIQFAWPWDFFRGRPAEPDLPETAPVTLALKAAGNPSGPTSRLTPGVRMTALTFEARNVPAELGLEGGWAELTIRWPDGPAIVRQVRFITASMPEIPVEALALGAPIWESDVETKDRRAKMREERAAKHPTPANEVSGRKLIALVPLPAEAVARWTKEAPSCRVDARLRFTRAKVRAEIPLAAGPTQRGDGLRLGVVALEEPPSPRPGEHAAALREVVVVAARPMLESRLAFAVVHRATGYRGGVDLQRGFESAIPPRVPFGRATVRYAPPTVWRDGAWTPAAGTEAGYSLIAASFEPAGWARRNIDEPAVSWRGPP